jgi:hypothetical protein
MAEARVARPKGISKNEWDEFIDKLGEYRALDPADPDNEVILQEKSEEIADTATALFLVPITP